MTAVDPFKAVAAASRRRHALTMYFGLIFVAVSIAAMAVLAMQFGALKPHAPSTLAGSGEANMVGSIMLTSPVEECRHKTFNNRTGQIADAGTPCNDAPLDAKGVPVPLGTVHTMDSISKTFK